MDANALAAGFDRRTLLAGTAALTLASAIPSSRVERNAHDEHAVLVFVFLRGGLDALSLCVPHGDPDLYRARPRTAVPPPGQSGGAIDLDRLHGLAPAAAPLLGPFRDGRLAFVQAVGSPRPTRSHFDAMRSVETGSAGALRPATSAGWLARLLEHSAAREQAVLRAVSLEVHVPDALAGARATLAIPDPARFGVLRDPADRSALEHLCRAARDPAAHPARDALAAMRTVEAARIVARQPSIGAHYPPGELGRKLALAAAWTRARLGVQVLAIDVPGFDMHRELGACDGAMAKKVDELARALSAFDRDLGTDARRVTLIAVSEFGRRVAENASLGTDHGRGGLAIVLGGGIRGGRVFGAWPGLAPDRLDEGDVRATTDVRDVLAEAARSAFGPFETERVFPDHAPATVGFAERG